MPGTDIVRQQDNRHTETIFHR